MVLDVDDHLRARQMGLQHAAVRPALGDTRLTFARSGLCLLFVTGGLDLFGLFEPQQQLILGERLSSSAEAVTLQFLDDLDQPGVLDVARQDHRLQRVRIVGNLVTVIAMTGSDHIRRRDSGSRLIHFVAGQPAWAGTRVRCASWTRRQSSPSKSADSCGRQPPHAVMHFRPAELPILQTLGIEADAGAIPEDQLDPISLTRSVRFARKT